MTFFSSLTKLWVLIEMISCTGRSAVRCGAWQEKTALVSRKLDTHTHTGSLVQKKWNVYVPPQAWYGTPADIPAMYRTEVKTGAGNTAGNQRTQQTSCPQANGLSDQPGRRENRDRAKDMHASVRMCLWVHSNLKTTQWKACKALSTYKNNNHDIHLDIQKEFRPCQISPKAVRLFYFCHLSGTSESRGTPEKGAGVFFKFVLGLK